MRFEELTLFGMKPKRKDLGLIVKPKNYEQIK